MPVAVAFEFGASPVRPFGEPSRRAEALETCGVEFYIFIIKFLQFTTEYHSPPL